MDKVKTEHWNTILKIFRDYSALIEWIKIFGSRARGDAKSTSDIDLAVYGCEDVITKLAIAFSDSNLPYTFDIIDYKNQKNEKLKQAVDVEGKTIFKVVGGKYVMTKAELEIKWEDYHRALGRLMTALDKELDADALYLDASIQRFEFSFELAWKLMKAFLSYEGIETTSPRSSIREGWKQNMLNDPEAWLEMQEKRKLSSHTYNEAAALDIYQLIKVKYVKLLLEWERESEQRLT